MKKSTIWFIAAVMGVSFLALLFLQAKYFEEVLHMRKEQFDESVSRCLYQTARNLELNETKQGLEAAFRTAPADSAAERSAHTTSGRAARSNRHNSIPVKVSKGLFWDNLNQQPADSLLRDSVRNRYLYQRELLGEVVCSILDEASEKPLAERIDFQTLDANLRSELQAGGINLDYHFYVTTSDGREVYRCADFVPDGNKYTYRQVLFRNGPSAQMGLLYIHFPDLHRYIFASVRFIIPAIIFTLIQIGRAHV